MAKRDPLTKAEERELERLKARLVRQEKDVEDGEVAQERRRDSRGATLEALAKLGMERQDISDLSKDWGRLKGLTVVGVDAARKQYRRRQAEAAAANGGEPAKG